MHSCEYFRIDFLYVYDGPSMSSNLRRSLTGIHSNIITSTGSDIFINFQSDYSDTSNGFKIQLSAETCSDSNQGNILLHVLEQIHLSYKTRWPVFRILILLLFYVLLACYDNVPDKWTGHMCPRLAQNGFCETNWSKYLSGATGQIKDTCKISCNSCQGRYQFCRY